MNTQTLKLPSNSLVRPYYPALDGLRAIAFLMVFLVHYGTGAFVPPSVNRIFDWGWMGVDLFFVLSGFLITGILYDSLHDPHYFKNFYIRRALRIFPLFYGVWIVLLLLTPILHIAWNHYNLYMAAYIGNFWSGTAQHTPGVVYFAPLHPGGVERKLLIGHFWSLCVEEQFYMVWPALVWLIRSRRKLLLFSLAVVALTPVLRILYSAHHPAEVAGGYVYLNTFFRMDTLFLGAALALWLRGTTPAPATIRRYASITAIAMPLLLFAGYALTGPHNGGPSSTQKYVDTYGFTLVAFMCAAVVLLALDPKSPLKRALQQRPLLFLGRMSYGLYVIHYIPILFVLRAGIDLQRYHLQFIAVPLAFAGTVGAAWLSFRFYETPFLRLKSVLAPRSATPLAPSPRPTPASTVETRERPTSIRERPAHAAARPAA